EIDSRISAAASRAFHIRRKHRDKRFSGTAARLQMAAHTATGCNRSLENRAILFSCRGIHDSSELVHKWFEGHYVVRKKISVEQIARIAPLHLGAKRSRRNIRDGNQHRRNKNAQKI